MTRSRAAAVALVLAAFASSLAFGRRAPRISSGPNIVVILTDDQTADSLPHDPPVMPYLQSRIDNPADHWISFPNAFINTPLCCPSRATILSGQYSHNTGVLKNEDGAFLRDSSTVATWLHSAGYWTGMFGKYLNRYPFERAPFIPPGWDEWAAKLHGDVTSVYFDYNLFENGKVVHYGVQPTDYMPGVLASKAAQFVSNAPQGRPFLLYFAPTAPHAPWTPAPRDEGAFNSMSIPASAGFNEEDVTDKPSWVQSLREIPNAKGKLLEYQHRNEFESLLSVDDGVKSIFAALQARGVLNNTIVFYLTDNGYSFGEHRWVGKRCAYDECARTPFFVRDPFVTGHEDQTVVSNADLAPTIAALGQTKPASPVDGVNLAPELAGNVTIYRPGVLIEWAGDQDIPPYYALRTQDFLYVEYPTTGERELYDLTGVIGKPDPGELVNVAGDRNYREIEKVLAADLARAETR